MGKQTGRDRIGRATRGAAALAGIAGLVACSPTERYHGYVPTEDARAAISLGDSPETVIEKAGQPTTRGVPGNADFFYVRSVFRHYGFFAPEEVRREVVAVSFGPAGVSNVESFDLSRGRIVPLTRRVTQDSVEDGTFLRQLAGAAGNFDPSALIDDGE